MPGTHRLLYLSMQQSRRCHDQRIKPDTPIMLNFLSRAGPREFAQQWHSASCANFSYVSTSNRLRIKFDVRADKQGTLMVTVRKNDGYRAAQRKTSTIFPRNIIPAPDVKRSRIMQARKNIFEDS